MTPPISSVPAGAIALARLTGWEGRVVELGMAAIHDGSRWTHVGVVTAPYISQDQPGGIVEAAPGGATESTLRRFLGRRDRPLLFMWRPTTTALQTRAIVNYAVARVNEPYSWLSYLGQAIPAARRPAWLTNALLHDPGQICSALADAAYLAAGIHLWDDDRHPWDVSPGDYPALAENDDEAWTTARYGRPD